MWRHSRGSCSLVGPSNRSILLRLWGSTSDMKPFTAPSLSTSPPLQEFHSFSTPSSLVTRSNVVVHCTLHQIQDVVETLLWELFAYQHRTGKPVLRACARQDPPRGTTTHPVSQCSGPARCQAKRKRSSMQAAIEAHPPIMRHDN